MLYIVNLWSDIQAENRFGVPDLRLFTLRNHTLLKNGASDGSRCIVKILIAKISEVCFSIVVLLVCVHSIYVGGEDVVGPITDNIDNIDNVPKIQCDLPLILGDPKLSAKDYTVSKDVAIFPKRSRILPETEGELSAGKSMHTTAEEDEQHVNSSRGD